MYDRNAAVSYAHKWAYLRNPDFYDFSALGGDCTNFASQVLFAGSCEMNYKPVFGWFYKSLRSRTPSWTGVNELYDFLINNRSAGPRAVQAMLAELEPGDLIQLDFNCDGRFDHTPVVVDTGSFTPDTILVAAHSADCDFRPLSSYSFKCIRFLHIL